MHSLLCTSKKAEALLGAASWSICPARRGGLYQGVDEPDSAAAVSGDAVSGVDIEGEALDSLGCNGPLLCHWVSNACRAVGHLETAYGEAEARPGPALVTDHNARQI